MTLTPLLTAPIMVQIHVCAALLAIVLEPAALLRRSRDRWHRVFGYAWVGAMAVTALSSFGIRGTLLPIPVSPIHALSVVTICRLWQGIKAVREGRITDHQRDMRSLYFWAMGVAGLFTFLPGRRMNAVFFADAPLQGFWLMAGLIGAGLAWYAYVNRHRAVG